MFTKDHQEQFKVTVRQPVCRPPLATPINDCSMLPRYQMVCSMSRKEDCYDNAMMESFFSNLKSECADRRFDSRAEARLSIFEYIEVWSNRQRRHSAPGYTSPEAFEQAHQSHANIWSFSVSPCLLNRRKPTLASTALRLLIPLPHGLLPTRQGYIAEATARSAALNRRVPSMQRGK
jgi:hypothetical protein